MSNLAKALLRLIKRRLKQSIFETTVSKSAIVSRIFDGAGSSQKLADIIFDSLEERTAIFEEYRYLILDQPDLAKAFLAKVLLTKLQEKELLVEDELSSEFVAAVNTCLNKKEVAIDSSDLLSALFYGLNFDALQPTVNPVDKAVPAEKFLINLGIKFSRHLHDPEKLVSFTSNLQGTILEKMELHPSEDESYYSLDIFENQALQCDIFIRLTARFNAFLDKTAKASDPNFSAKWNPFSLLEALINQIDSFLADISRLIDKVIISATAQPDSTCDEDTANFLKSLIILKSYAQLLSQEKTTENLALFYESLKKIDIALPEGEDCPYISLKGMATGLLSFAPYLSRCWHPASWLPPTRISSSNSGDEITATLPMSGLRCAIGSLENLSSPEESPGTTPDLTPDFEIHENRQKSPQ